ncbi:hypothetical protein MPH_13625 [Macrophomina phaseolina MS6]|uniref:Uncharacterized protein n=1 Tax=Macrophomina phaseolina (strain MS6) TaxID=1126212 RepID=K2RGY3_MACPH|nr:hypothetical protein MPH_13625 [Macrophomina phaseolina MS6]
MSSEIAQSISRTSQDRPAADTLSMEDLAFSNAPQELGTRVRSRKTRRGRGQGCESRSYEMPKIKKDGHSSCWKAHESQERPEALWLLILSKPPLGVVALSVKFGLESLGTTSRGYLGACLTGCRPSDHSCLRKALEAIAL